MSNDVQAEVRELFDKAIDGPRDPLKHFMQNISQLSHDGKVTFLLLRKLADELSYEFILELLKSQEIFNQVNTEDYNEKKVEEIVSLFLRTNTIGRKRAML